MRKVLQILGIYLVIAGISGTLEQVAIQPIMGVVLNAFNRFVLPHIEALKGHEVAANLGLSVAGAVLLLAVGRREKTA